MADIEITPEVLRAVGQRAAASRRRVTVACVVCGKEVQGTVRARFCSTSCRTVDYYRNNREKVSGQRKARRARVGDASAPPAE